MKLDWHILLLAFLLQIGTGAVQHYQPKQRRFHIDNMYPSCMDLKNRRGMQTGEFLTRDPAVWKYRADGSREYSIETCRLKRFTSEEARECLAGEHVVFVGDSLTRYQYLSLAYFVEHGDWPPRFSMYKDCPYSNRTSMKPVCNAWGDPSILAENDWAQLYGHAAEKSWKRMHMHIGGEGMNGRLECQCARLEADTSTESMFYVSSEVKPSESRSNDNNNNSNGADELTQRKKSKSRRVKITFLNDLAIHPVHWWKPSGCAETATCNLNSEGWDVLRKRASAKKWDVEAFPEKPEFASAMSRDMPDASVVLVNEGIWGGFPADKEKVERIMGNMYNITSRAGAGGRCLWKGTTATPRELSASMFAAAEYRVRKAALKQRCEIYDLTHVTQEFTKLFYDWDVGRPGGCCKEHEEVYFDGVHFRPWANEEFNQILLNVLC